MKILRNFYLLAFLPVLVLLTDLLVRQDILLQFNSRMRGYYLLSIAGSFLFYLFILLFLNQIARKIPKAVSYFLAFLIAIVYSFSLIGSYGYYFRANMLPNYFVFHYMIQEPLNSFTLLKDSLSISSFFIYAFLTSFSFFIICKFSQINLPFSRVGKTIIVILGIFSLSLLSIITFNTRFQDQLYVSDINTIAFASRNILNRLSSSQMGSTGLQSRTKTSIRENIRKPKFNILLVVAESLRRDHLSVYNYERETTPFLKGVVSSKPKEFFLFQNAYSNASSTLISLPSILTGASPVQSAADTHSYPVFWEYGKKAEMDTFYITSHSLAWNNLNGYLSNSGIDFLYNRETSGESIYNDIGIDDRKTLLTFDSHIKKLATEKKTFAGVLHLNTNHFPFFVPGSSKKWDGNDVKNMYDNSVYHFDRLMESMFKSLSESGTLDNTIILITSDHGESLLEHNYLGHIESYYLEAVSIPMIIYIPKSLQKESQLEKLYTNTHKNVMNLDIIPAVVDLLLESNKDNFKTVQLGGKSLLGEISSDRTIIISNNNEISLYKVGISYIRNDMHYIVKINSIPKKEELYNIRLDHFESRNIWGEQDQKKKIEMRNELNGCSVCSEILSNL